MLRNPSMILWVVVVAVVVGLYALTGSPTPSPEGKTLIRMWHPWPGSAGMEVRRLVDVPASGHDREGAVQRPEDGARDLVPASAVGTDGFFIGPIGLI